MSSIHSKNHSNELSEGDAEWVREAPVATKANPFDSARATASLGAIEPTLSGRRASRQTSIGYRAEIDGLRALAVLPVVLFHADLGVPGGYLGVDIFFVISGHLIASIILADLERDRFDFGRFCERRARRILPALFAVALVSLPFAWAWLTPKDFTDFAQSVAAIPLFGTNFLFWYESGYFNAGEDLKPFLHTWSLSVEGQFYVVFPLLLLLVWRYWRRALGALLVVGVAASLAFAEYESRQSVDTTFYLIQYRSWELLAGGTLAYLERTRGFPKSDRWGPLLALLGLVCIVVSFALFDDQTRHPSLYTLLPVAGTALVIVFGGHDGFARSMLSANVMVGLGVISYSLYLWHQPIFAFANHYLLDPLSPNDYAALIALSVIAAIFSWWFIEIPFRRPDRIGLKAAAPALAVAGAALLTFGFYGHFQNGVKTRFAPSVQAILDTSLSDGNRRLTDEGRECFDRDPSDACHLGDVGRSPTWALLGDSHAGALGPSFDAVLAEMGVGGLELTEAGCAFALGMRRHDRGTECLEFSDAALQRLLNSDVERVVLMAWYALYVSNERFDNGEGGVARGSRPGYGPPQFETEEERREALLTSLTQSVERLIDAGKKVVLVYPVPEVGWDVPVRLAKLVQRGREMSLSTSYARYRERTADVFEAFDSLGDRANLVRVYPHKLLCNRQIDGRCSVREDGKILYSDDHHLSLEGARRMTKRIFAVTCARWGCADAPQPNLTSQNEKDIVRPPRTGGAG